MSVATAGDLHQRVLDLFRRDPDTPLRDDEFNTLAMAVFAFQFENNAPLAAYCVRRRRTPRDLEHWSEIPAVPTAAFKEVALLTGAPARAPIVFRTSGTTRGSERRGAHFILEPAVYEAALLPMFTAYLLPDVELAEPDGRAHASDQAATARLSVPQRTVPLAFISLIPGAEQVPDSSLSFMATQVARRLATTDLGSFMDAQHGLRESALEDTLDRCIDTDSPVLLLGTSLAFAHWLESLASRKRSFRLPEGSRLMDTGGFKGFSRTVPEVDLRRAYTQWLDVPEFACVNEYGMTEMCSQFYDSVLRDRTLGRGTPARRCKPPAPWVRTRVVHPDTLEPVAEGEVGILQHFDLANLYSVMAVQTEDLGRTSVEGIETLGRVPGAVPRGCSIALDLLMEANRK